MDIVEIVMKEVARITDKAFAEQAATIAALRKRVEELEVALEPFASAGGTPMFGDEEQVPLNFNGKHFRRARNALSATAPDAESSQNGADSAALRDGGE